MPTKLALTSIYTLTLLFGFLAALFFAILQTAEVVDFWAVLVMTVVTNFIFWLIGPMFMDLINRWFYKAKFYREQEFSQQHPDLHQFISSVAQAGKIRFPKKIGIIEDGNPTAYTYGSAAFNARIVITSGLLANLERDEVNAVLAHEMGHIVHRDFIVMTIANTMIQIMYQIYRIFARRRSGGSKKGNALALVGLMAFVFYYISFYIVLFLSRTREYYADEFSAKVTGSPTTLSKALVKIGYGIMTKKNSDKENAHQLLEGTRTLGIMGLDTARETGLVAQVTNMDPAKIARVLRYDFINPWAKIAEIGSTHPLTGKRLAHLDHLAVQLGQEPMYHIPEALAAEPIDYGRIWHGFFLGAAMYFLPFLVVLGFLVAIPFGVHWAWALVGFGITVLLRTFYSYPGAKAAQPTDVYELMSDPYSSPLRGRPIAMSGTIIGRGQPGFIFSEDQMFQDKTGLMYLDYYAGIPMFGNILFAWKKVKALMGQPVSATGWFFRSNIQKVVLEQMQFTGQRFRSYTKFWNLVGGAVIALIGGLFLVVEDPMDTAAMLAPFGLLIIFGTIILSMRNSITDPAAKGVAADATISGKRIFKGIMVGVLVIILIVIFGVLISNI